MNLNFARQLNKAALKRTSLLSSQRRGLSDTFIYQMNPNFEEAPKKITITGASGQIAYFIAFRIGW
jgi:hypothetical protein